MDEIKVLVADDHALFRCGIISVLTNQEGLSVVGEAVDGNDVINKANETDPDVILMDLNMPNCNGLEATKTLQLQMPKSKILILTVSDSEEDLFDAIRFGARGYLLKNIDPGELIKYIIHVAQGGVIISPLVATDLLNEFKRLVSNGEKIVNQVEDEVLSPREEEVLKLVARGDTNKQIADTLSISDNTVKTHLRNILEKLHLANRIQAAAYAVKKSIQ